MAQNLLLDRRVEELCDLVCWTIPCFWLKTFYQLITILSYANSMVNPILYAFLSDNFRRTFARAFGCASAADVERVLKKTAHQPSEMMPDDGAMFCSR